MRAFVADLEGFWNEVVDFWPTLVWFEREGSAPEAVMLVRPDGEKVRPLWALHHVTVELGLPPRSVPDDWQVVIDVPPGPVPPPVEPAVPAWLEALRALPVRPLEILIPEDPPEVRLGVVRPVGEGFQHEAGARSRTRVSPFDGDRLAVEAPDHPPQVFAVAGRIWSVEELIGGEGWLVQIAGMEGPWWWWLRPTRGSLTRVGVHRPSEFVHGHGLSIQRVPDAALAGIVRGASVATRPCGCSRRPPEPCVPSPRHATPSGRSPSTRTWSGAHREGCSARPGWSWSQRQLLLLLLVVVWLVG